MFSNKDVSSYETGRTNSMFKEYQKKNPDIRDANKNKSTKDWVQI